MSGQPLGGTKRSQTREESAGACKSVELRDADRRIRGFEGRAACQSFVDEIVEVFRAERLPPARLNLHPISGSADRRPENGAASRVQRLMLGGAGATKSGPTAQDASAMARPNPITRERRRRRLVTSARLHGVEQRGVVRKKIAEDESG